MSSQESRAIVDGMDQPTPPSAARSRVTLASLDDVARELARVYRKAERGLMPWGAATKAAFILTSLGKVLEAAEVEKRLDALEGLVNEQAETH